MECPIGHSCGRTYNAQLITKHMHTEAVFHLNDRLIAPLNLKEVLTLLYAFH